jgi:hypothetical protein
MIFESSVLVKTTNVMLSPRPRIRSGRLPFDAAATARMLSTDRLAETMRAGPVRVCVGAVREEFDGDPENQDSADKF